MTSKSCDCGRPKYCLYDNLELRNLMILRLKQRMMGACEECFKTSGKRCGNCIYKDASGLTCMSYEMPNIKIPKKGAKCAYLLSALKAENALDQVLIINKANKTNLKKNETKNEKMRKEFSDVYQLTSETIKENEKLKKNIIILMRREDEHLEERRRLKREIKLLKNIIIETCPTKSEPNTPEEQDTHEAEQATPEETDETEHDKTEHDETEHDQIKPDVFEIYQKLKII